MTSTEDHECWACGVHWPADRPTYSLEVREQLPDGRLGNWLAVMLCIECQSLIKHVLDGLRRAHHHPTLQAGEQER